MLVRPIEKFCTEHEVAELKESVELFQAHATNYFGRLQRSNFHTKTFHSLYYAGHDIRQQRNLMMLEARLYETRQVIL